MKSDQNAAADQATGDHPFTPLLPWRSAIPALISAAMAMAIYLVTVWGTYVYDDIPIVLNDPRVRQPHLWGKLWTSDYFNGGLENLYRPLVSSSYAIEWWLHGDKPWIFHAVNILLHALVAAGVAEFTRRALRGAASANAAALIAGSVFALHPIHIEAVANIVGRAELACDVSLLASLIVLCRRPLTTARAVAVFLLGFVAVLCKEQGILAPVLWVLFGWLLWPRSVQEVQLDERKAIRLFVLITTWGWAIYLIAREHFFPFEWDRAFLDVITQPMIASFGVNRLLMPVALLGRYSALLLWPNRLSLDYGADVIGSTIHGVDPNLWIGFLSIGICFFALVWSWKQHNRFILFCLLSMGLSYGMIGNIVTLIGTNFAERLIYLPSAFFLMIIGTLIARIAPRPRAVIVLVLLAISAAKTFTSARTWNHPTALFQAGIEAQPRSIQLRFLLAQEYHARGDYDAADAAIAGACDIYPNYWRVWYQRGLEATNDDRFAAAEKYLNIATKLNPNPMIASATDRLREMKSTTRP